MSRHPQLYHWTDVVSSHFPHLSKPLAAGLALWSLGMILARSCRLTAVAGILAPVLAQPFNTVRERWRDTYREAPAKAGAHRVHLELRDWCRPYPARLDARGTVGAGTAFSAVVGISSWQRC